MESFPLVGNWVAWQIGDGRKTRIGQDPWVGSRDNYRLPANLISTLKEKGIKVLADASMYIDRNQRGAEWKMAQELNLSAEDTPIWNSYIKVLRENFIHLGNEEDSLKWTWNTKTGKFSTKMGYDAAHFLEHQNLECWWWSKIWKTNAPLKTVITLWLALNNKLLTWEVLRRRGFEGLG